MFLEQVLIDELDEAWLAAGIRREKIHRSWHAAKLTTIFLYKDNWLHLNFKNLHYLGAGSDLDLVFLHASILTKSELIGSYLHLLVLCALRE